MKIEQLINHFRSFYIDDTADEEDIDIVITHLNDIGSLSYFYHVTKEFEKNLSEDKNISTNLFQMILTKWFARSVEDLTFILP